MSKSPSSTDPGNEIATNAVAVDPAPLYFEDYTADLALEGGNYLVTEAEILEFGRRFDPQPIHTDPLAAAASPFGSLIAPGCLTFAIRNALHNQLPVRPVLVAGLGLERLDRCGTPSMGKADHRRNLDRALCKQFGSPGHHARFDANTGHPVFGAKCRRRRQILVGLRGVQHRMVDIAGNGWGHRD